jgi:CubicO group peptidase (beta-lactamase class C family)
MINFIDNQSLHIHSILILRHGQVVFELYYPPFSPQEKHLVFSVSKSFISALIGIAIQEGKIQNIDNKVIDFFPDRQIANLDARKKAIRIRDLLNMTSGLTQNDMSMVDSADWAQFSLDQPMNADPGTSFDYTSENAQLLSAILQKATGKTALAYAQEHLFAPLGIKDFYWADDPSGTTIGGFGLMLTTREMASFGYLYLQGGKWNGQQVVPAEWVRASSQSQIPSEQLCPGGGCELGYSNLWWQTRYSSAAEGYGGENIIVVPAKDLVVVFTAGVAANEMEKVEALPDQFVLPAIKSDQALPASPSSKMLSDRLAEIANPKAQPMPSLPAIASTINGKTMLLGDNPLAWEQVSLTFEGNQAWLTPKITGSTQELKFAIGLDDIYRLTRVSASEQPTTLKVEGRYWFNPFSEIAGFMNHPFMFGFLDGLPVDGSVAMKGKWTSDSKFLVTIQDTRDFDQQQITFTFGPSGAAISWISFMNKDSGPILTFVGKFQ